MGEIFSKGIDAIKTEKLTSWEDLHLALQVHHTIPREKLVHCDLTLFHRLLKGHSPDDLRQAYKAKMEREITFMLFDSNHEGYINSLEVLAAKCFFCRGPQAAEKCHYMFELFDEDHSDSLDQGTVVVSFGLVLTVN